MPSAWSAPLSIDGRGGHETARERRHSPHHPGTLDCDSRIDPVDIDVVEELVSRKVKPKDTASKASHSELEELKARVERLEKFADYLRRLNLGRVSAVVNP